MTGVIIFLAGFAVLIVLVANFYLLPAFEAAQKATPIEKHGLSAYSRLLLAILLVMLVAGLVLSAKLGRLFLPKSGPTKTKYVDAWTESGKRSSGDGFGD
jgi:type II secretory pathway component PulF